MRIRLEARDSKVSLAVRRSTWFPFDRIKQIQSSRDLSDAAGRPGTPDEVATEAALLIGTDGGFITGSDSLIDGGVTAAYWYGELAPIAC